MKAKSVMKRIKRFVGLVGSPLAHEDEKFPASVQAPIPGVRTEFLAAPITQQELKAMEDQGVKFSPTHLEPQREGAMYAEVPNAEKKKRGRPPKHATEADRKAADAARKRDDRAHANAEKNAADEYNPASEDAMNRAQTGGTGSTEIELTVAMQDAADAVLGPGTNDGTEWLPVDRKKTAVPINPDVNTERSPVNPTSAVNSREMAASMNAWIKRGSKQDKDCKRRHQAMADKNQDSEKKVYCNTCKKLLVNPGKDVKGISRTPPNSRPETPPSSVSS
jgi:AT hook motif